MLTSKSANPFLVHSFDWGDLECTFFTRHKFGTTVWSGPKCLVGNKVSLERIWRITLGAYLMNAKFMTDSSTAHSNGHRAQLARFDPDRLESRVGIDFRHLSMWFYARKMAQDFDFRPSSKDLCTFCHYKLDFHALEHQKRSVQQVELASKSMIRTILCLVF